MGIKNNIPAHLMHPNIDVDIIVSEEPPYGLYFYHQKA